MKTEQQSKKSFDASDSEEDSDNGNYCLHDTSDDSVNYLDFMDVSMTQEINDESEEVNDENKDVNNERRENIDINNFKHVEKEITVGSHVLVKFLTYKSQKHYIGEVIKIYDHSYTVKFLRNKGNGRFAFPITEDISVVFKNDIEEILQNPLSERRGIKTFDLKHVKIKIE